MEKERTKACEILDVFENFLADSGVEIPNEERDKANAESGDKEVILCALYGTDYYKLEDEITKIIKRPAKPSKSS